MSMPPTLAPGAAASARHWRVKTPTILQMEAVECGAAALAIIMAHYRRFVPLAELRQACGVSRDGSKASNVVKAARTYGFVARGFRREPAEVRRQGQPVIAFWNFNHFLVVEGFASGKVFLNDPATGPRWVSEEEFDQGFTGVVLEITPGPGFQPGGEAPGLWPGLRRRLPLGEPALAYLVIAGLFLVVPGLVLPVFSRIFIDDFLVGNVDAWIKPLLLGMGVTMVLRGLLTWLQRYTLIRFHNKLALSTSSKFVWHVLRLPLVFYAQRSPGDIGARVAINDRVAELMTGELAGILLNTVMAVFFIVLMLAYDGLLTAVAVLTAVANVGFLRLMARRRSDATLRLANDGGKVLGASMNGLQMMETLKASGMESDFFAKWSGLQTKFLNGQQAMGSMAVALGAVPPLLTALNTAVMLSLGGLRVMDGVMTMGMLVAFQSLAASFIDPINQLVSTGARFQELQGDMNRLDDVLHYPCDPALATPEIPAWGPKLEGRVELQGVSFGYSPLEPPLLEDFHLTLRPGTRVALVGPSGCGKSTVARLVLGLYAPWSGEVRFDGIPRSQVPRAVLLNSLSMVSQEVVMFEGSVRDNLTLWDDTVPEERLVQAAMDACIHEAIAARQGGYDSPVQEGGGNFSGGQRQRMEIARALATDPRILVLDEATSALDPVTEMMVDDHLRRRGCTCLIIAHRLSTIRDCDEIIVLDRGKVVQRGTHQTLRAEPGPYAALMEAA